MKRAAPSTPKSRVLIALNEHVLPEIIGAVANLSPLVCLRTLQELEAAGVVERFGRNKQCWRKK